MSTGSRSPLTFSNPEGRGRKLVRASPSTLVTTNPIPGCGPGPLLVSPATTHINLTEWAKANKDFFNEQAPSHGAILFRGFGVSTAAEFEQFAEATSSGGLLEYRYGSTPRRQVAGGVYTSTEYPADQVIPMHNEMSYSRSWPRKIWFCCLKRASAGGATPIANSANVFGRISPPTRGCFMRRGVSYVRNYGSRLDVPLQQVFGTPDRDEIASFCSNAGIECEWSGNQLRTRQTCQATAVDPTTGAQLWFNQAHLFHVSSLATEVAAQLLEEFGEAGLPRNAYFGDGSPIDEAMLEEIREAYRQESVSFAWEEGDVLMLDNMLMAHGREPYTGERRVVVAMAEQHSA
jgi:alpha-ketoglutarate-dependent taurine dioxygenase